MTQCSSIYGKRKQKTQKRKQDKQNRERKNSGGTGA